MRARFVHIFALLGVAAALAADLPPRGCPAHVRARSAKVPNELIPETPSSVFWLRSLFKPEEAADIVAQVTKKTAVFTRIFSSRTSGVCPPSYYRCHSSTSR